MKGLDAQCTCRALRRCDIDDLAGERPVAGCEGANATQAQLAGVDRTCQVRRRQLNLKGVRRGAQETSRTTSDSVVRRSQCE